MFLANFVALPSYLDNHHKPHCILNLLVSSFYFYQKDISSPCYPTQILYLLAHELLLFSTYYYSPFI